MEEPRSEIDWRVAQKLQLRISGLIVFVMVVIWAATGFGTFWPIWVWFGLAIPLGVQYAIRHAVKHSPRELRALSIHAALTTVHGCMLTFIWALTGFGFWLFWPLFGTAAVLGLHGLGRSWWRELHPKRERELTDRVDVLTRTRRGALDAQAAELRRIERDLHDGAQARLVALSMQLGRAEDRLEAHPEAAELVRSARIEASNAIKELRDLARGIAPPVLADRGLPAAVESLGERSALPVKVDARLGRRLSPGHRVRRLLRGRRVADQRGQARPRRVGGQGHADGGARTADRRDRRQRAGRRRTPTAAASTGLAQPRRGAGWHPGRRE